MPRPQERADAAHEAAPGPGVESGAEPAGDAGEDGVRPLADLLSAIANPLRLRLVRRLQRPAFIPDLTKEFGLTRQALKRHLDDLERAGIIAAAPRRRGALPTAQYTTDPAGFFALREMVADLGLTEASGLSPRPTMLTGAGGARLAYRGPGLLLVHGDQPGRFFAFEGTSLVVGRDPKVDVPLPYDGFASGRHAMLQSDGPGWRITDLHSTNGTGVNFARLPRGGSMKLAGGDIITVGRSHLALRLGR